MIYDIVPEKHSLILCIVHDVMPKYACYWSVAIQPDGSSDRRRATEYNEAFCPDCASSLGLFDYSDPQLFKQQAIEKARGPTVPPEYEPVTAF